MHSHNHSNHHDDTPQRHIEYIDKGSWWPQWQSLLGNFSLIPPSLVPATPTQQGAPINYVVVRNTSNLPMNSIMPLIEQYTNSLAQQSSQSPSQTVIVVLSGNTEGVDTNSILNRLFMSHQPQTTPASRAFIENLDQITITPETIAKQYQCTVCMEDFKLEEKATQLPCKHCFHQDCIKPWLNTQHTCPVCRLDLPTESQAQPDSTESQSAPLSVQPGLSPASTVNSLPPVQSPSHAPVNIDTPTVDPTLVAPSSSVLSSPSPSPSSSPSPALSVSIPASPIQTPPSSPSSSRLPIPPATTPSSPTRPTASGIKRGFLVSPSKDQSNKKKKVDESDTKETDQNKENKDSNKDNGFGFKRGFLL